MKRLFLLLGLFFINIGSGYAKETDVAEHDSAQTVKQEVEKYEKKCFQIAYPEDYMDHVYALMDDSLKYANQKYHQCIKNIIIDKISNFTPQKERDKMLHSLDKIENGILNFYWILYNMEDNGFIGRQQNDAILGRYYEGILEDIILYEQKIQYR